MVREYAEALIIAVLLALVIRTFVVQAFKIPSGSMLPTLQIGDHILVNKFLYYFRPIQRGDIIVFKFPQDETRDFIKRVIGLPGETVEIRGQTGPGQRSSRSASRMRSTGTGRPGGWGSGSGGPDRRPSRPAVHDGGQPGPQHGQPGVGILGRSQGQRQGIHRSTSRSGATISHTASPLPSIYYVLSHPSMVRWTRSGAWSIANQGRGWASAVSASRLVPWMKLCTTVARGCQRLDNPRCLSIFEPSWHSRSGSSANALRACGMMNTRHHGVLRAIVQDYIRTAEPVGSRTISRKYGFSLSPATIRTIMADLEELGYLAQPHTSAGRVPTDKGYRPVRG